MLLKIISSQNRTEKLTTLGQVHSWGAQNNVGSCQSSLLPTPPDDDTLLLVMSHTSVAKCRESNLELSQQRHLHCLSVRVLEGAREALGEEALIVLHSYELCKSGNKPARWDVHTWVTVARLLWGNHPLSKWIWGLFHRQELRPGTKSLVSIPCLGRW